MGSRHLTTSFKGKKYFNSEYKTNKNLGNNTHFSRETFQRFFYDILDEAQVDDNDKAAEKRIIFVNLEKYAHVCSQPEILACPNIDQRGICQLDAPADHQDDDLDDHDGESDSADE